MTMKATRITPTIMTITAMIPVVARPTNPVLRIRVVVVRQIKPKLRTANQAPAQEN